MLTPEKFDSRRLLVIHGNPEETILWATHHFIECAKQAIKTHGKFTVALSGGSTPKAIYQKLAESPTALDWSKVHLFWSDERSVAPDHPDSNYHMALEAGLKNLPIPPEHIHRMVAESDIEANATAYQELLKKTLKGNHFDLVMLGMGDDGHTASLFPGTAGINETKQWVVANHVPQLDTWRMSLTFPFINKAHNIAIYVIGESKKERLHAVLKPKKGEPPYPIQNVGTDHHNALFIVDTAAAALL